MAVQVYAQGHTPAPALRIGQFIMTGDRRERTWRRSIRARRDDFPDFNDLPIIGRSESVTTRFTNFAMPPGAEHMSDGTRSIPRR